MRRMETQSFVSVTITNFDGIGAMFDDRVDQRVVVSGSGTGSIYYAQSVSLSGLSTTKDVYTNLTSTTTGIFENVRWQTSISTYPILDNVNAPASTNFIRKIFEQYRSISPTYVLDSRTNGVADVRLHNVEIVWSKNGIEIKP